MARAKSWSESQQPENQYTYGQYWFNVMALLLIALAMIAVLVYVLWPQPKASTKVFLVRPEAGSEVRSIPFQESDFEGLKSNFVKNEIVELDSFNDKASFEQVIDNLKDKLGGSCPTTAIVVCSAIGAVEDGNPILRPTTSRGENIEVKEFLKNFVSAIDCQRYVIILDCGHDYSKPLKYFEDSKFQPGDDFNKFTAAVEGLVKTDSLTEKPIAVITANGDGEIPLYSYNKRRTLFGLALQDAFANSHSNVDELCKSLVRYCHLHGGDAAQTPALFKSQNFDEDELEIASLNVLPKKQDPDKDNEESEEVPIQDVATTKGLKQIASFWRERDEVESKFDSKKETLLLPADFQTLAWERELNAIIEKTADLRNEKGSEGTTIGELGQSKVLREARTESKKFSGLLSPIDSESEPVSQSNSSEVDPRVQQEIERAFFDHHRAKLKAKYHMAIFESLSWLDSSPSLKRYKGEIDQLTAVLLNPLFANAQADEKAGYEYLKARDQIVDELSDVEYQLKKLCEFLGGDDKYGFTREMALMCLLDSPLIESGSSDPEALHEPHKRDGLMDALKRDVVGSGVRLNTDKRKENSKLRNELFDNLEKFCERPDNEFEVKSRKQDSIAYYMNVGRSKLLDLKVNPKPIVYNLALKNRIELERTKQIELKETEIDLGLIVKTGTTLGDVKNVNIVCELPDNAPFEILNGTTDKNTVRINNSDGLIRIKALKNAAEDGVGGGYVLKVKVEDSYLNKRFATNEAKSIEIPLALPGEDRIELVLSMSGNEVESTLRPLPNRDEVLEMSLVNFYHQTRTVKATLYACKSVEDYAIMPGSIDATVKDKTLGGLDRLPAIAVSAPVKLANGKPGQPSEPAPVIWSAKPDPQLKMMDGSKPVMQGLICRVVEVYEDGTSGNVLKDFWIPLFPEDGDLFSTKNLLLDPATGQVRLAFVKSDLGQNRSIKLVCRLGNQVVGRLSIPADKNVGRDDVIIENWGLFKSKSKRELLHIDVNEWPRRYSFINENGRFLDTLTNIDSKLRFPNIAFDVKMPKPGAKGIALEQLPSSGSKVNQTFGYKKKEEDRTVEGVLKITCNTQEHFQFPGSRNFVEVKFGGQLEKFYFPRDVQSFVSIDPEDPKRLLLKNTVTDFSKRLNVEMNDFKIDPIAIQTNTPRKMDGKDITRIVFDNQPPEAPRFQISGGTKIYPGRFVEIQDLSQVVDSPGGVGVSNTIKDRIRATIRFGNNEPKKAVLGYSSKRLGIMSGEAGDYQLSIAVCDLLGNFSKPTTKSFRVVPKPPKKKPKAKVVKPPPKPKPVTYVLIVNVFVGSRALKADEEPELVIEPEEGVKMARSGASYTFTGLKAGEAYSVTGEFEFKGGLGKIKTEGKISWETAKDWSRAHTEPKTLRLEQ